MSLGYSRERLVSTRQSVCFVFLIPFAALFPWIIKEREEISSVCETWERAETSSACFIRSCPNLIFIDVSTIVETNNHEIVCNVANDVSTHIIYEVTQWLIEFLV